MAAHVRSVSAHRLGYLPDVLWAVAALEKSFVCAAALLRRYRLGASVADMRATICVDVNRPDECAAVEAWFERWRDRLTYVSENRGCGCCVNTWDVDGPDEAVSELPSDVRTVSDWSDAS